MFSLMRHFDGLIYWLFLGRETCVLLRPHSAIKTVPENSRPWCSGGESTKSFSRTFHRPETARERSPSFPVSYGTDKQLPVNGRPVTTGRFSFLGEHRRTYIWYTPAYCSARGHRTRKVSNKPKNYPTPVNVRHSDIFHINNAGQTILITLYNSAKICIVPTCPLYQIMSNNIFDDKSSWQQLLHWF